MLPAWMDKIGLRIRELERLCRVDFLKGFSKTSPTLGEPHRTPALNLPLKVHVCVAPVWVLVKVIVASQSLGLAPPVLNVRFLSPQVISAVLNSFPLPVLTVTLAVAFTNLGAYQELDPRPIFGIGGDDCDRENPGDGGNQDEDSPHILNSSRSLLETPGQTTLHSSPAG